MEAMGSQQQQGRKRVPNRERPAAAEEDALNQIAREAEARLAAKRAARAEAREIRMKELERQQKEIYQVQKKYYGLDTKFGDIEQWMEDSERYTRKSRRNASASDEDERMSVGSRGSLRSDLDYASAYPVASCYSDLSLHCTGFPSKSQSSSHNGNRASLYDENFNSGTRRYSASSSRPPSEYSCYLGSGSRASSRASSARASPVVEERPEKDFEKGVRTVSSLSAATLASLGGTSSRRGSGDTSISVDTEASIREIKDINELKDQIQDVQGKYMQGLKEMKDSLAEVEEKYKKAMVSNAQLDNEKTNFMYQVDTLKDALLELEEQLAESKRQYDEKSKDFEREKHAHNILQFQFMEVKEALKQREELLAEIRQLQQKQEGYVREISDLQETIEWKEKKIGALERQKEFFDTIRSERDDLREEVIVLKEQLKQHGIIPNSEVATNGETSGGLHNDGLSNSSKMVPGTSHTPEVPVDGTLGRANEVEMKNENMGKREILQNTEHEEHTEETKEQEIVQECSEIKTLHADEKTEAEKITDDKVVPTLVLNSVLEEPAEIHSEHVAGIVYSPESSDVVEFRVEGGSLGQTTEVKALDENVVNKTSNQSKETDVGIEVDETIKTDLEMLPQKQNKEKETDTVTDEGEDNNNEIFQEALDFVNDSQMAVSTHSESSDLADDMLTQASAIHSNTEQSENKIVESDLLIKDGSITIANKAQWDENEAGGIDGENEMENVLQQQENKADSAVEHIETPCAGEQTSDNLTEEQKQVEMEESESPSSNTDAFNKEEQSEQHMGASEDNGGKSLAKGTEQEETVVGMLDENVFSEKSDKQNTMTEVQTEDTVVDSVKHNEEKRLELEDDSGKCSEIKPECINAGKALGDILTKHEEGVADSQDNETPTDEQRTEKQDDSIPEVDVAASMVIEDVEDVWRGNEEDTNHRKTKEKVTEVLPDVEAADLKSEKAEFGDQKRESDSEEEHLEEYHEASDFSESSFGELKDSERNENQGNELEANNHKKQETLGTAESALHHEAYDNKCRENERLAGEDKKESTSQISADKMGSENMLTESKNTQQQKEAEPLQTDTSIAEPPEAQCEMSEDTHKKILDKISSEQIAEYTSEQLEKLGVAEYENQLDAQVGRKGKGKSREDCVIS
ncbi:leucine-rich repeat flightless-interacting protein 1 isoform X3 [Sceloporus undulatus]|uniref:leucine-rich repeat flightless-interacting protein 1 isoform X3 n=1 Tax=Sceloporus undulatus TaxID=8520 RepID=UPI001C4BAF4D|nr:leucine-rich repeat flightless-interacting protein 1 isoform X3 [Sceloporus undulatus]